MISNKVLATDRQIEQEIQDEIEQDEANWQVTLEDHDLDHASLSKREIPDMDFWEEQAFENERCGFVSAIDDFEEGVWMY